MTGELQKHWFPLVTTTQEILTRDEVRRPMLVDCGRKPDYLETIHTKKYVESLFDCRRIMSLFIGCTVSCYRHSWGRTGGTNETGEVKLKAKVFYFDDQTWEETERTDTNQLYSINNSYILKTNITVGPEPRIIIKREYF